MNIDHGAVLGLIIAQQQSPRTACAYLGADPTEIREDLEGLDQHWTQTLRTRTAKDGSVTGACVIEWDEEVGRSWVHGPWATAETWEEDAPELLRECIDQAPVAVHEMHGDVQNVRMAELAAGLGWRHGRANFEYRGPALTMPLSADCTVRPAAADDLDDVARLHDESFPGTYATARQLLDPASVYTVLVALDASDTIIGYLAAHRQGEAIAYLDFIAIDAAHRGGGHGRALLASLGQHLPHEEFTLTVDEHRPEAIGFYRSLGARQGSATRPYRLG